MIPAIKLIQGSVIIVNADRMTKNLNIRWENDICCLSTHIIKKPRNIAKPLKRHQMDHWTFSVEGSPDRWDNFYTCSWLFIQVCRPKKNWFGLYSERDDLHKVGKSKNVDIKALLLFILSLSNRICATGIINMYEFIVWHLKKTFVVSPLSKQSFAF